MIFAWDDANRDHIAEHAVTTEEAEFVVESASPPFPQELGDGKRRVWGATDSGRLLQVIYMLKQHEGIAFDALDALDWAALPELPEAKIARVIHAMELTAAMKRQFRRRKR